MLRNGIFLFLGFVASLQAVTWTPTTSPSQGQNSDNPILAMDGNGNTLALWTTGVSGGNNHVYSAYLPAGSTTWTDLRSLAMGSDFLSTPLDMNASGRAVGAWEDAINNLVGAGIYNSSTASWIATQTIPNASDVAVAINDNGVAIVIAGSPNGAATSIEGLIYNGVWMPVATISGLNAPNNAVVKFDNNGFAIAIWDGMSGGVRMIQTSTYNLSTGMWGPVQNISPAGQMSDIPSLAINLSNGTAVAGWTNATLTQAQIAFYDGSSWGSPINIPGAPSGFPLVGVDAQGNAVVSWLEQVGAVTVLKAARRSFGSAVWGPVITISDPSASVFIDDMAVNTYGDAAIVWEVGQTIYGSVISGGTNTASAPALLATPNFVIPSVVVGPQGQVTAAWRPFALGPSGAAITQIPRPLPRPSFTLTAEQKINRFLAQSELYNQLNWTAPSSSIVFYRIYRNGTFIAEIEELEYKDHHRIKGEIDTYTVIAIDNSSLESSQQTVTVP
jgi:hypothetical protein